MYPDIRGSLKGVDLRSTTHQAGFVALSPDSPPRWGLTQVLWDCFTNIIINLDYQYSC